MSHWLRLLIALFLSPISLSFFQIRLNAHKFYSVKANTYFRNHLLDINERSIQKLNSYSDNNDIDNENLITQTSIGRLFSFLLAAITSNDKQVIKKDPIWNKKYLENTLKRIHLLDIPIFRKFLTLPDHTNLLINELLDPSLPTAKTYTATTTTSTTNSNKQQQQKHNMIDIEIIDKLRILQLNMLADGLSGLRDDLGAFSRISNPITINWSHRRDLILHEILQYNPDIITLQECDHFYDWFLPLLQAEGYDGVFAPKPARWSVVHIHTICVNTHCMRIHTLYVYTHTVCILICIIYTIYNSIFIYLLWFTYYTLI